MDSTYIIYDNVARAFFEAIPEDGKDGFYITHNIDNAYQFSSKDEALDFAEKNIQAAVVLKWI